MMNGLYCWYMYRVSE